MSKALSFIKPGQLVTVTSIQESELKVRVLFRAPFGDPIAIDVHGYVLSLRLDEAGLIQVNESIGSEVFA